MNGIRLLPIFCNYSVWMNNFMNIAFWYFKFSFVGWNPRTILWSKGINISFEYIWPNCFPKGLDWLTLSNIYLIRKKPTHLFLCPLEIKKQCDLTTEKVIKSLILGRRYNREELQKIILIIWKYEHILGMLEYYSPP